MCLSRRPSENLFSKDLAQIKEQVFFLSIALPFWKSYPKIEIFSFIFRTLSLPSYDSYKLLLSVNMCWKWTKTVTLLHLSWFRIWYSIELFTTYLVLHLITKKAKSCFRKEKNLLESRVHIVIKIYWQNDFAL